MGDFFVVRSLGTLEGRVGGERQARDKKDAEDEHVDECTGDISIRTGDADRREGQRVTLPAFPAGPRAVTVLVSIFFFVFFVFFFWGGGEAIW